MCVVEKCLCTDKMILVCFLNRQYKQSGSITGEVCIVKISNEELISER